MVYVECPQGRRAEIEGSRERLLDKWVTRNNHCGMDEYEWYDDDTATDLQNIDRNVEAIRIMEAIIRETVIRLRSRSVPWLAIANELRVTRQAAQQRYGRSARPSRAQLDAPLF
jgi:hypothetical protein